MNTYDIFLLALLVGIAWYVFSLISKVLKRSQHRYYSELVWRGDPTITHEPDIEKDFDQRFDMFLGRMIIKLPDFLAALQKQAIIYLLRTRKLSLKWVISTRDKEDRIKRILMELFFAPISSEKTAVKFCFAGERVDGTFIDLSEKDTIYIIKINGDIESA